MFRYTRLAAGILVGAMLVGCGGGAGSGDGSNKMTAEAPSPTELAAYAASHQYPTAVPSNELRVAAIVNSDRSGIRLYNFSNSPLPEIDVWVNGSWLQHVRGLPANGSVVVRAADLYNAFGKNFASQSEPVSRVQIRTANGFYNAMGPVTQ